LKKTKAEQELPRYVQIYNDIRAKIRSGELRPGNWVGSEAELAERYRVSRVTVRQALVRLSFDGLIRAVRGKGTFVNARRITDRVASFRTFEEEMAAQGVIVTQRHVSGRWVRPTGKVASMLGLRGQEPVFQLQRVRLVESEVIEFETSHVPGSIARGLDLAHVEKTSTYSLVEAASGIAWRRWWMVAFAGRPTRREAAHLGQSTSTPVLIRESACWFADGRAAMYSRRLFSSSYQISLELSVSGDRIVAGVGRSPEENF
jgi:GntR family transcriptional regulator